MQKRECGFLLLEVLLALAVLGMMMTWVMRLDSAERERERYALIGAHLSSLASSLDRYLQTYREALMHDVPIVLPSGVKVVDVYAPTVEELSQLGMLKGVWTSWNGIDDQGWRIHIQRSPQTCTSDQCHFLGIVWLPSIVRSSGRQVSVYKLMEIMRGVHVYHAIYIDPLRPLEWRTADGVMQLRNELSLPGGVVGVLCGEWQAELYLRRSGAFPMMGDLLMGQHAIQQLSALHATGVLHIDSGQGEVVLDHTAISASHFTPAVYSEKSTCTVDGALARSPDYQLIVCTQGRWVARNSEHVSGLRALFMPFRGHAFYCQDPHTGVIVDVIVQEDGQPTLRIRGHEDWVRGVRISTSTAAGTIEFELTPAGIHLNGSGVPLCYFPL